MRTWLTVVVAAAAIFLQTVPFAPIARAAPVRSIVFPVIGSVSYYDDFGAPRSGHTHQGNDLLGRKGLPLVATVDGRVRWVISPETGTGLGFAIEDDDGYAYWYLHVNNDTPDTDDGASRGIFAYAPDVYGGNPVVAGQLLGWMGDSGNAESTTAHLHFEIHDPDGSAFSPYESLVAARRISTSVIPPALPDEILPYNQFTGGASVALGDVDPGRTGDEIVTGAGPGGGPLVRVYAADGTLIGHFFAFEQGFRGGIDVATGDTDGDGSEEVIVSSNRGRTTEVRVFTWEGAQLDSLQPFGPNFIGGAHVATADLTGDGRSEFIAAPLRGGGPNVRIYDGPTHTLLGWFFAYAESFRGGVDVAAYPETDSTPPLIVTTPMHGGGPNTRVYNGMTHELVHWFFAGDPANRSGRRVTLADVDTNTVEPEIVVVPEANSFPVATVYDITGTPLDTHRILEPWWEGGYDIAAADGVIVATSGTPGEARRRTTVRWLQGSPINGGFDFGGSTR
jgi:hypothetical protein